MSAMIAQRDGHLLLPRLIRYIEERRAHESRYTGAIEAHPSALCSILWGADDPIALVSMAARLHEARPTPTSTSSTGSVTTRWWRPRLGSRRRPLGSGLNSAELKLSGLSHLCCLANHRPVRPHRGLGLANGPCSAISPGR